MLRLSGLLPVGVENVYVRRKKGVVEVLWVVEVVEIIEIPEVQGPSGPQLLVCGPSGLLLALRASLTSSFGRSGRVTQNLTHMLTCVRSR